MISENKRMGIGWKIGIIAGFFPFTVGTLGYFHATRYNYSSFIFNFKHHLNHLISNGDSALYEFPDFYIMRWLAVSFLMCTGFSVISFSFFGLKNGLRSSWFLILITAVLVGLNDILSTLFNGRFPIPVIPVFLTTLALYLTKDLLKVNLCDNKKIKVNGSYLNALIWVCSAMSGIYFLLHGLQRWILVILFYYKGDSYNSIVPFLKFLSWVQDTPLNEGGLTTSTVHYYHYGSANLQGVGIILLISSFLGIYHKNIFYSLLYLFLLLWICINNFAIYLFIEAFPLNTVILLVSILAGSISLFRVLKNPSP